MSTADTRSLDEQWAAYHEARRRVIAAVEADDGGRGLGQEAYLAICAELGIDDPIDVENGEREYAVRHGDFRPPHDTPEQCIRFLCAWHRLSRLDEEEEEEEARRASAPEPDVRPRKTCYVCGAEAEMAGSLGSLCAEHYDEEESRL